MAQYEEAALVEAVGTGEYSTEQEGGFQGGRRAIQAHEGVGKASTISTLCIWIFEEFSMLQCT